MTTKRPPALHAVRIAARFGAAAAALAVLCGPTPVFDCGSNGSFGELTLAAYESRTVQLPPDGILHVTTLRMAYASTLQFQRNALNTPVHILCQGDVVIDGGATITVNGSGGSAGPGGFDGGSAPVNEPRGSDGFGPGAGQGGWTSVGNGNHAVVSGLGTLDGAPYGNILQMPLIGGSGGGGSAYGSGGGGGGAILLASNTMITLNGSVIANGAGNAAGGGVRFVAPKVLGSGGVSAVGAFRGRMRIDTLDPTESHVVFAPAEARVLGANMTIFPPVEKKVELIDVAGTTIDPSTNVPVTIVRAPDSATHLPVTVRATNFTGSVTVSVVLTPRALPRRIYPVTIDMAGGATASGTVHVDFDPNMLTRVDAWAQ